MKKRISAILFSVKSSISNKPMALLLLIMIVILATVTCGALARLIVGSIEDNLFHSVSLRVTEPNNEITTYGEAVRKLKKNGFIADTSTVWINQRFTDITLSFGDKSELYSGSLEYAVYNGYRLTEEMISEAEDGVIISQQVAALLGLSVGDRIDIANNSRIVLDIDSAGLMEHMAFYLSYRMPLNIDEGLIETTSVYMTDLNRSPNEQDKLIALKSGLDIVENQLMLASLIPYIIALVLLITIFVLNILYILNYIESVNSKKYEVMKIIGGKPIYIAMMMAIETVAAALIGLGIGVGIEYAMTLGIDIVRLRVIGWTVYLLEFVVTVVTVMIATTLRIIKRIKSPNINKRNM